MTAAWRATLSGKHGGAVDAMDGLEVGPGLVSAVGALEGLEVSDFDGLEVGVVDGGADGVTDGLEVRAGHVSTAQKGPSGEVGVVL